jgi:hypothetical protein
MLGHDELSWLRGNAPWLDALVARKIKHPEDRDG